MVTATPRIKPSNTGIVNLHRKPNNRGNAQRGTRRSGDRSLLRGCAPNPRDQKALGEQIFAMKRSTTANLCGRLGVTGQRYSAKKTRQRSVMAQARPASSDFNQAFGEAKKQENNLAGEASNAAQDVYEHTRDKATDLADHDNDEAQQTSVALESAQRD